MTRSSIKDMLTTADLNNDESVRGAVDFKPIDPKYDRMLKAGLSRVMIESALQSDGHTASQIIEFWKEAAAQGMRDALKYSTEPNAAWTVLKPFQKFMKYEPSEPSAPRKPGHIRIVCISDTHGLHDHVTVPDGDILLHAGDFSDTGDEEEIIAFSQWLGRLPHKYKIVIAGNHESTFQPDYYESNWTRYGHKKQHDPHKVKQLLSNCVYLEDELVVVEGIRIYGSPWQPNFCNWAFNLPRGEALQKIWASIPDNVDILLTHSPPLGRGDVVCETEHVGCVDLLNTVQFRVRPKYHIFGHVHESFSYSSDGYTVYINASTCNDRYDPINPCIVIDYPMQSRRGSGGKTEILEKEEHSHRYERLKRRASMELQQADIKPPRSLEESHPHPSLERIEGSDSDKVFQKKLQERYNATASKEAEEINDEYPYSARAMKYVFSGPFREAVYARRRERMKIDEVPDYTLPDEVFQADSVLKRPAYMMRRFTDSFLTRDLGDGDNEAEEEKGAAAKRDGTESPEVSGRAAQRRSLLKRKAARFIPSIEEEDHEEIEGEGSGHVNASTIRKLLQISEESKGGLAKSRLDEDDSIETIVPEDKRDNSAANTTMSSGEGVVEEEKRERLVPGVLLQRNVVTEVVETTTAVPVDLSKKKELTIVTEEPSESQAFGQTAAAPIPASSNQPQDCILCQLNVAGHIHSQKSPRRKSIEKSDSRRDSMGNSQRNLFNASSPEGFLPRPRRLSSEGRRDSSGRIVPDAVSPADSSKELSSASQDSLSTERITTDISHTTEPTTPAEAPCALCALKVPGHIHQNTKTNIIVTTVTHTPEAVAITKEVTTQDTTRTLVQSRTEHEGGEVALEGTAQAVDQKEECLLCKYNVAGHKHERVAATTLLQALPSVREEIPSPSRLNSSWTSRPTLVATRSADGSKEGDVYAMEEQGNGRRNGGAAEEDVGDVDLTSLSQKVERSLRLKDASASTWF